MGKTNELACISIILMASISISVMVSIMAILGVSYIYNGRLDTGNQSPTRPLPPSLSLYVLLSPKPRDIYVIMFYKQCSAVLQIDAEIR